MKILLASASPRRREILSLLTKDFDVRPTSADEDFLGGTPEETVLEIATRKANAASICGYDAVIASDTLVYLDGEYYGKPEDESDAFLMLKKLVGKTHTVYTAVVLRTPEKSISRVDKAFVSFRPLTDAQIDDYVKTYKPLDKAGAYAIQDKVLVSSYSGSYTCIMGLPIAAIADMMDELALPHNPLDKTKDIVL